MAVTYLLPLKDRRPVAEGTLAFWFDTTGTDLTFKPGQYANFTLTEAPDGNPDNASHLFSLASSPHHKDFLMIASRMRDSGFKNTLKTLPLGTRLQVNRPAGRFLLHEDASKPAVFLAGGIGITPFLSMIEWATEMKSPHKICLIYSNRTPQSSAFLEELSAWQKQNPNLKLIPTVDAPDASWPYEQGPIDEDLILQYVPEFDQAIFYAVGPPGMVEAMDKLLARMRVEPERIRMEKFDGY